MRYRERDEFEDFDEDLFYDDMNNEFAEYEEYDCQRGKQKNMKMLKEDSKPKWRSDRKKEKKFKHEVLGID